MEEAVMKKFIHEESPSVLQLCGMYSVPTVIGLRNLFFVVTILVYCNWW